MGMWRFLHAGAEVVMHLRSLFIARPRMRRAFQQKTARATPPAAALAMHATSQCFFLLFNTAPCFKVFLLCALFCNFFLLLQEAACPGRAAGFAPEVRLAVC